MLAQDIFPSERRGLVTASRCHVLFPKRSAEAGQRSYALQLAKELYFDHYDEVSTWQMEHGQYNEIWAKEHYEEVTGIIGVKPEFVKKGDAGGGSDFLSNDGQVGVDFKCPTSLEEFLRYHVDGITEQQYHQAQMYSYLYGTESWYICPFLTETNRMSENGLTYPLPKSQRMLFFKVEIEKGWGEKLEERVPKIIEMRDEFIEQFKKQFPR